MKHTPVFTVKSLSLLPCCIMALCSFSSVAGLSLDRTRVIITEKDKSASINLTNVSKDVPYLAQSWLTDQNQKKVSSPLVVLPPLQRVEAGEKAVVRITKTPAVSQLPKDRESIFYLNIREIPPKSEKPNTLQLAIQSKIKLFYRPAAIIPKSKSEVWQEKLIFHKKGNRFSVENPTPYYVTITGLGKTSTKTANDRMTSFTGVLVPPKGSESFDVKDGSVSSFVMSYVNDYGGHPEINFSCAGNTCNYSKEQ